MNSGEDWTDGTYPAAEEAVSYSFKDRELLKTCFTHRSYTNAHGEECNERLEFLGDAVLGLSVTETLYAARKDDEGKLTELRKQYVSRTALQQAEQRAGLMRFLRYCGGDENLKGKTPSNLFEAVVAGIYLDGGMKEVKRFLARYLSETETENYKTMLQEYVQERVKTTPEYSVREEEGGYSCLVRALGRQATGTGESKKAAETEAAKKLYQILTEKNQREF